MILEKMNNPEDGDVFIKRKFAFLPRIINDGKNQVKVWFRFYYEKRVYRVLLPGLIEGWEITDHLKDPSVSNIRRIK